MAYRRYPGFRLGPVGFLIILNLLFFVATLISQELIFLLGLQPIALASRPWTFITSLFVHGNFGHIIANMFTLFFFGTSLSRLVGERRFLLVYFGGGILGNILYILLAYAVGIGLFNIVIGASGAVFSVGGALAVMRPKLRVFIFPLPIPIPLWTAVIGGFLILSIIPGIAWQAHLGGLVFGLVAGYFFKKRERYTF